ncbi:RDD family protein [Vibrio sagamiensis]|uniref:RDD domain-containing protein n=1 Tax=Vibrio sagamiensis NBRC 104589 TaxID=1219064 RepID=A0A511QGA0_9VIBR|nr:RDD family protein [Vibrio sagamiensis]PNQ54316.1 hypothetical protein C1141_16510 [Vibrio agarivorans]GEM76328.1 hypothetical protein VSA01S_24400 [Vibrio sagamiensis NBRC 104589]
MNAARKFRRTGAFVIDVMIAKMFTQVVLSLLALITANVFDSGILHLSLNDDMALPTLWMLMVIILMSFIGVYIGYCSICYNLLGKSLGKYLLQVEQVEIDKVPNISRYLKRERKKIFLLLSTLGFYYLYVGIQYYLYDVEPLA